MQSDRSPTRAPETERFDPTHITRPDSALLKYYLLAAICSLVFAPIVFLPLFVRYKTLRYQFDDSGVSMSWGLLFRREVHLTYRRIQDIHLTRNILQRWMGLATVGIQTASGSAGHEMGIEGVLEAAELRDYLYAQMRGARGLDSPGEAGALPDSGSGEVATGDEALTLLHEIRDLLVRVAEKRETPS